MEKLVTIILEFFMIWNCKRFVLKTLSCFKTIFSHCSK